MTTEPKQFQNILTMSLCPQLVTELSFFSIYGQFGAIRKPDSRSIFCQTYIFFNSNLLSYKSSKQNKKIFNTTLILLLWLNVLYLQKKCCHKQNTESFGLKMYIFWKLHMFVFLHIKFKASSIIVTSFRQGVSFYPVPLPQPQSEPPKCLARFGLKEQID